MSPADVAALAKLPISLLSTFAAAAGYLAFAREARPGTAPALAGTFLLAAGAAALNAVIDRDRDARMVRTRHRPIPAGRIGAVPAASLALVAAAAGTALLWASTGPLPALLGLAALAWYDGVYTPLKRVTAFAVLPGALVGALPPAIGWTAAGGTLTDVRLHALCAFILLWQVPHFWLISLRHAEDFARGGFPTPASRFSAAQVARISFAWTLATAGGALLFPLFGVVLARPTAIALAAAAVLPVAAASGALRAGGGAAAGRRASIAVDLFAVAAMALVAGDALLGP